MKAYLPLAQLIISVFLIAAILLQQRGTALGSSLGQDSGFYSTRRGIQKNLLWITVGLAALLIASSILNLIA